LRERLEELENQLEKTKEKLRKAKTTKADEERHAAALKEKLAKLDVKMSDHEHRCEKLERELENSNHSNERLEHTVARLELQKAELNLKNSEIMRAHHSLIDQLKEKEEALKAGDKRSLSDSSKLIEVCSRVKSLEQENAALREKLESLSESHAELQEEHHHVLKTASQRARECEAETRVYVEKLEAEKRSLENQLKDAVYFKSTRVTFEGELSLDEELAEIVNDKKASFLSEPDSKASTRYLLHDDRLSTLDSFDGILMDKSGDYDLRRKVLELEETVKSLMQDVMTERGYVDELSRLLAKSNAMYTNAASERDLYLKVIATKRMKPTVCQRLKRWLLS